MLTSERTLIQLKTEIPRIVFFSPAYADTFLIIAVNSTNKDEIKHTLVHLDKKGEILYQYPYEFLVSSFIMLNQA